MAAGTIPVYYGCSNIEALVPADCFIDYRAFSSLEELDARLQNLTDEEYLEYVKRMSRFLDGYNAPYRHSVFRLYETVAKLCESGLARHTDYPEDYLNSATFTARLRYEVTNLLLPHYRLVYPAFTLVRGAKRLLRK